MTTTDRRSIEKIIEQELSAILLRSAKIADQEGKPEIKEVLRIILTTIGLRRDERLKEAENGPARIRHVHCR
jgi:hypothetical protein